MGLVVFISLLFSFHVEARTCRLPDKPVQDQDGLGSCYANTASLMMEHNLKLTSTPSYFQMSLNASAHRGTFMYTDDEGSRDIFNSGGWVCDTFDSAKRDGFCDAQTFKLDAVGKMDPQHSQENFLKALGTLIDENRAELKVLSNSKQFSVERQQIERRLAGIFQQRAQICQVTQEELMQKRFFDRLNEKWTDRLANMKPGEKRTALARMYERTFKNGLPTPEAKNFLLNDFFPRSFDAEFINSNPTKDQLAQRSMHPEKMFEVWWWNRLKLPGSFSPYDFESYEYLKDFRSQNVCRENETIAAVKSLVSSCGQIPPTLEPRHEQMARELLAAIQLASQKGESGLRGLVNLISPSCGAEMSVRKGKLSHECDEQSIKDDISALAAAKTIEDEICGGRSVGISLCTGFFISTTPVDSGYCSQDVPGIEQHGRHAVALVGVKNNAIGEREFLIQNSWGRTCPFLQHKGGVIPDALKGLVQCEMANGVPTGRFWVNEKLMMNNTYAFQVMK